MGKLTEKLKSVLKHHDLSDIPAKQVDRWEGEGGFVPLKRKRFRRSPPDRTASGNEPADGGSVN